MARTRRTYTQEFKRSAVQLLTEQGRSVAEAARSLGIGENLLKAWSGEEGPLGETGLAVDWLLRERGIAQVRLAGSFAGQGDWRAFFYVPAAATPPGSDLPQLHVVLVTPHGRQFLEERFLFLLQRVADLLDDLEAG